VGAARAGGATPAPPATAGGLLGGAGSALAGLGAPPPPTGVPRPAPPGLELIVCRWCPGELDYVAIVAAASASNEESEGMKRAKDTAIAPIP